MPQRTAPAGLCGPCSSRPFMMVGQERLIITYLKNNLSTPDGVMSRFKMLTYYMYAPLFHRLTPCQEP
jgi:hypothetical protein